MGNFGNAVTSLLDTYTKCLSLLKGSRKYDAGPLSDTQSTLSASLRSDRSRVRKAYVSRLSKDGSRFEKGDGESLFPRAYNSCMDHESKVYPSSCTIGPQTHRQEAYYCPVQYRLLISRWQGAAAQL